MKLKLFTLGFTLTFSFAGFAASVIDFEDLPLGPIPGDTGSYMVGGVPVAFNALGLEVEIDNPVPGNHTLHSGSFYDPITVTFGIGFTVDFVEIGNLFDNTSPIETDTIIASAYSASGMFLGSITSSDSILHLALPGTARVVFDDVGDTGFAIDDFRFQVVPESSILALLAAGLMVVSGGVLNRRRLLKRTSR